MKSLEKFLILVILAIFFNLNLNAQHDGYLLPSEADTLIYQKNFSYPDSLKKRYNRDFDVRWAVGENIEEIIFIKSDLIKNEWVYTNYIGAVEGDTIYFFYPNGATERSHKSEYNLWMHSLDLIHEAPVGEDGYADRSKGGRRLSQNFYAFSHGDEVWILRRGLQERCDCPSQVAGYVWKNQKQVRMLTKEELRRALYVAHKVDE